jgi:hypothetical protein
MSMATGYGIGSKTPKGYEKYSLPTMDPGTAQFQQQLLGAVKPGAMSGMDFLSKLAGGDQSMFQQMEAPAFRQFEGAMGQLGSRFAGMGMGANKSSGMRLSAGGMASDLAQSLQSQRMGMQQNAIQQLMSMSQNLMQNPTQAYGLAQKPVPVWAQLLGSGIGATGTAAGGLLGNAGLFL